MRTLTNLIAPREASNSDTMPDLRSCSDLVLASDYAGDGSPFQVLAYLLVDRQQILSEWDAGRREVRERHLKDGRRIEFKKLGDESKQKAIVPFLRTVDSLNGILFCVAIERSVSDFSALYRSSAINDPNSGEPLCKSRVWETLIRVSLFGSILVGGLGRSGQCFQWITDEDDIVANETLRTVAAKVWDGMLGFHCPGERGSWRIGIAGQMENRSLAEDLVAIPDLAAGTTVESLAALGTDRIPTSTDVFVPILAHRSTKTQFIFAWLSDSTTRLKKLTCIVRPAPSGQLLFSMCQPDMLTDLIGIGAPLWLPLDRGWKKSSHSW